MKIDLSYYELRLVFGALEQFQGPTSKVVEEQKDDVRQLLNRLLPLDDEHEEGWNGVRAAPFFDV